MPIGNCIVKSIGKIMNETYLLGHFPSSLSISNGGVHALIIMEVVT